MMPSICMGLKWINCEGSQIRLNGKMMNLLCNHQSTACLKFQIQVFHRVSDVILAHGDPTIELFRHEF